MAATTINIGYKVEGDIPDRRLLGITIIYDQAAKTGQILYGQSNCRTGRTSTRVGVYIDYNGKEIAEVSVPSDRYMTDFGVSQVKRPSSRNGSLLVFGGGPVGAGPRYTFMDGATMCAEYIYMDAPLSTDEFRYLVSVANSFLGSDKVTIDTSTAIPVEVTNASIDATITTIDRVNSIGVVEQLPTVSLQPGQSINIDNSNPIPTSIQNTAAIPVSIQGVEAEFNIDSSKPLRVIQTVPIEGEVEQTATTMALNRLNRRL